MAISIGRNEGIRFRYIQKDSFFTLDGELYIKTDVDYAVKVDKENMLVDNFPVVFDLQTNVRKIKQIIVLEE